MVMLKSVLFTALLTITACSKKKEEAPAPADKPTSGAPAAPASPAGGEAAMDCDKVLPKELRDKYFAGATVENHPHPVKWVGQCKITPAGEGATSTEVNASCHTNNKLAKDATLQQLPKSFPEMKPIDGVADSLWRDTSVGQQFTAYAGDCKIDGLVPKGVDLAAFAKDWLAALPPK